MSEKEKTIIQKVTEAIPKMSDMDKGYFLGFAEGMMSGRRGENEDGGENLAEQDEP